jgi:hypothetical protein
MFVFMRGSLTKAQITKKGHSYYPDLAKWPPVSGRKMKTLALSVLNKMVRSVRFAVE